MVATAKSARADDDSAPHSELSAYLIERHYADLGCDRWDTRRVQVLMAKLGATRAILAAMMRIRPSDFERRMEHDCWTKQDGFILTVLEREIDFLRGGIIPKSRIIAS